MCNIAMEFTASSAHSSTDNDQAILAQECLFVIIAAIALPYDTDRMGTWDSVCVCLCVCVCVSVRSGSLCWCASAWRSSWSRPFWPSSCGDSNVRQRKCAKNNSTCPLCFNLMIKMTKLKSALLILAFRASTSEPGESKTQCRNCLGSLPKWRTCLWWLSHRFWFLSSAGCWRLAQRLCGLPKPGRNTRVQRVVTKCV